MKGARKNYRGFTLIEIMVVVGIFSMAMVAIFGLYTRNISVQARNKDFLTASMLAQEGLEMVRNVRDRNWLVDPAPPDGAFNSLIGKANDDFIIDYRVDPDPSNMIQDVDATSLDITGDPNFLLYINSDGFYRHDTTVSLTPTRFYRIIKVNDQSADTTNPYVEFTATVQWRDKGVKHEYAASTLLYDWR